MPMNIIFSIIRLTYLSTQNAPYKHWLQTKSSPPSPVFSTSYYPVFWKEEDSGTCQHFNEICNLNQDDGGKSQCKVMYAYYLWVETLNSMLCWEYLQMERACRLQQDDRLLCEQQQEKANDSSAFSNRNRVKIWQGMLCAGLQRERKELCSSGSKSANSN
jgi:hypothetical protein